MQFLADVERNAFGMLGFDDRAVLRENQVLPAQNVGFRQFRPEVDRDREADNAVYLVDRLRGQERAERVFVAAAMGLRRIGDSNRLRKVCRRRAVAAVTVFRVHRHLAVVSIRLIDLDTASGETLRTRSEERRVGKECRL